MFISSWWRVIIFDLLRCASTRCESFNKNCNRMKCLDMVRYIHWHMVFMVDIVVTLIYWFMIVLFLESFPVTNFFFIIVDVDMILPRTLSFCRPVCIQVVPLVEFYFSVALPLNSLLFILFTFNLGFSTVLLWCFHTLCTRKTNKDESHRTIFSVFIRMIISSKWMYILFIASLVDVRCTKHQKTKSLKELKELVFSRWPGDYG